MRHILQILSQEYLLSNWLDVLQQIRLEDPIETTQDVVNRGLGVIVCEHYEKDLISSGAFPELAEKTGISDIIT